MLPGTTYKSTGEVGIYARLLSCKSVQSQLRMTKAHGALRVSQYEDESYGYPGACGPSQREASRLPPSNVQTAQEWHRREIRQCLHLRFRARGKRLPEKGCPLRPMLRIMLMDCLRAGHFESLSPVHIAPYLLLSKS